MNILVLCTGNSARSILGEALIGALGAGRVAAHSAGSHPKGQPHPEALARLRAEGIAAEGFRSKSWDEFSGDDAPRLDIVITVCDSAAGETCPYWAGAPVTVHWGLPDPAGAQDEPRAFAEAFAALKSRVEAMLALPLEDMTPAERKTALSRIHTETA
ncbi:arsenate reductase ArsC [Alphaproteobacteria bacterium GH1-50]|uniref:Arsenate reductase ArsC n=1 Tax=Kangsaoukella pontilimi TaxID=2691042 RepID=A0A7C9IFQ4_9RHOB|nr:arsenate reductase ArsC [Kangsaoukella pontilimi]